MWGGSAIIYSRGYRQETETETDCGELRGRGDRGAEHADHIGFNATANLQIRAQYRECVKTAQARWPVVEISVHEETIATLM